MTRTIVSVYLDLDLIKQIDEYAKKHKTTRSRVIEQALREFFSLDLEPEKDIVRVDDNEFTQKVNAFIEKINNYITYCEKYSDNKLFYISCLNNVLKFINRFMNEVKGYRSDKINELEGLMKTIQDKVERLKLTYGDKYDM
jgi:Ribbon-helix-helix protein, copG family.